MKNHSVAVWSGVASFLGSALAIGAIDFLNPGERAQFLGALFVSLATGGVVYARQRVVDARVERRVEDKESIPKS